MRKLEGYTIMNYNYEARFKELTDICRRKDIVITSEFTNMRTKVKFKCLKCGTLGEKVPSLLKTQECPCKECRKNVHHFKYTNEEFKELIQEKRPSFIPVEEFKGMYSPIDFIHLDCGKTINILPENLLKPRNDDLKHGCKYCSRTYSMSDSELRSYFSKFSGYKFNYSFKKNQHLYANVKHLGKHNVDIMVSMFRKGTRCPVCSKSILESNNDFLVEMYELGNGEYSALTPYTGSHDKIHLLHNCGKDWWVEPTAFKQGQRCPSCGVRSHGEIAIARNLDLLKIDYIEQKKFSGCRYELELPFDFYLPKYNVCIEYDGIQHFKPVSIFGGKEALAITKVRDSVKNNYCIGNSISLYRIPYTVTPSHIGEVLNDILSGIKTYLVK